ncbi:hypothetical protein LEP1GSC203_0742 [Leptospira terpstrae serovar Hualin str. LT 11-33 = ATCC 700639]|uniref:Uncharacterized protein n=1 Tax=Leptospira terpstrae serovar Hualin str. LT 11-33 = ATCC 700639 TaxID=1257025 RepID=N1VKP6_9LEPT|nr:hypothetical protein LEP1GSC203_0742 [Leptospira terpstrae serovar Hualin str. LT 11-33 = ATCC 700639]
MILFQIQFASFFLHFYILSVLLRVMRYSGLFLIVRLKAQIRLKEH